MKSRVALLLALLTCAVPTFAQSVSFTDPAGDDDGPGGYIYPTDRVYLRGSFDLTAFRLDKRGALIEVAATMNAPLSDPWATGNGFALQAIFIFIDQDGKKGSGHTEALPGLNVTFAPESAWEKVIVLNPLPAVRTKDEAKEKAAQLQSDIIVPSKTRGAGQTITGTFDSSALGEGDPATWSYQVLVQSNEGAPNPTDFLLRPVNEYEGQHRFGGGSDEDCDPQVLDLLAGNGTGAKEEIAQQHKMLAYDCAKGTLAVISTVRAK